MDNQQLRLRAVEPADIDFLYRIENIPAVWSVSFGDAPVSRQMLWDYINSYSADIYTDRQLRLIIDVAGSPVGTVDITDFNPRNGRAMLGIAVDPEHQRKGYARAALNEAITRCRQTFGMHQLAVMVPRSNEASMKLFESLGFSTSGCLKSWLRHGQNYEDVIVMQLML